MRKKFVKKNHETLLHALNEALRDQPTGFMREIEVGKTLFPYSLPPVVQIILLDPVENMIAFRIRSNPEGIMKKASQWQLGTPAEAIDFVEEWVKHMMEIQAGDEKIEIREIK